MTSARSWRWRCGSQLKWPTENFESALPGGVYLNTMGQDQAVSTDASCWDLSINVLATGCSNAYAGMEIGHVECWRP